MERQRIIFRGRVLKNGERLSHYGIASLSPLSLPLTRFALLRVLALDIQNESVLHLVERPETSSSVPPVSESGDGNNSNDGRRPGLAGATANILLHTMQVDPSAGPAAMAQEISRSVMEALRGVIDGVSVEEGLSLPGALFPSLFGSPPTASGSSEHDNGAAAPAAPNMATAADRNAYATTNSSRFDPFAPPASIFSTGSTVRARAVGGNAFVHPMGIIPPPNNATINSPNGGATVHTNVTSLPSTTGPSVQPSSRLLSRPTSVLRPQVSMNPVVLSSSSSPPYAAASHGPPATSPMVSLPSSHHQTVRTDPRRALQNLNEELSRLTTFADGADLFPLSTSPLMVAPMGREEEDPLNNPRATDTNLLVNNLAHFERAYLMLCNGCRELRVSLEQGETTTTAASAPPVLPWDRLANLMALLHELPLLMISQRRLLGSLRAVPPHGSVELPPSLDVPSFLARETGEKVGDSGNGANENRDSGSGSGPIAAIPNSMDTIEPPE